MKKIHRNSFSWEVKKEVINNVTKNQEIIAFISGLLYSSAEIVDDAYVFMIKNEYILDKVIRKFKKIKVNIISKSNWKTKLAVKVKDFKLSENIEYKDYLTSFFAGVFCGSGSISGKESTSYHLEISSHNTQHLQKIQEKLNQYEFGFHMLKRKNKSIIYIKHKDKLIDFLSAIGAKNSWYKLQNLIIERDFKNVTNRINNIDVSNLNKIAKSTLKHNENIEYIFENNLKDQFNENQLKLFELKLRNEGLSFTELVYILNSEYAIPITKSGVNHWFRKLEKTVLKHKENH
ncbi:DNA-binding protein WhiA [Mycoplasma sp. Pen4]|uniref:DNA-binding protein WhiA n=1 Tax=Mycoplasma sp. Pen4 TaxID=640330 RepID=UPI0016546358|nr:DNA-binding protein WhiA [Mycoplasma sp. Pen4]QNM93474.1 DNA-binding protein WhiA [Mycoplasma sp. Pen4]